MNAAPLDGVRVVDLTHHLARDRALGREVATGGPLRPSRSPLRPGGPAPRLGRHTDEVPAQPALSGDAP